MKTIGLMGAKQSGKSTVGGILAEDHGFVILEPGMQVMELLLDINPSMEIPVVGEHNEFYTLEVVDLYESVGYQGFKEYAEGRRLLQELGTRIRERDPEFWVRQQLSVIREGAGPVVSTAVRFPNEAEMIRSVGGEIWMIKRPGLVGEDPHESEHAWRTLGWDHEIVNDGTLSDLASTVRKLIGV